MLKIIPLTLFTILSFNAAYANAAYANDGKNYVQFSLYGVNQKDQDFTVRGISSENLELNLI